MARPKNKKVEAEGLNEQNDNVENNDIQDKVQEEPSNVLENKEESNLEGVSELMPQVDSGEPVNPFNTLETVVSEEQQVELTTNLVEPAAPTISFSPKNIVKAISNNKIENDGGQVTPVSVPQNPASNNAKRNVASVSSGGTKGPSRQTGVVKAREDRPVKNV